jgi:hypothetical protein
MRRNDAKRRAHVSTGTREGMEPIEVVDTTPELAPASEAAEVTGGMAALGCRTLRGWTSFSARHLPADRQPGLPGSLTGSLASPHPHPRAAIFNHANVVSLSHLDGPGAVTVSAVTQVSEKQQWTS